MKKRITILTAGLLSLILTSCIDDLFCVNGNGNIEVESRRLTSFDEIENSTSFEVIYTKADTLGARITTDENLLEYIETNIRDGCLEIRTKRGNICLDYTRQPIIAISSPDLKGVVISGSGDFFADTISGETITLKVTGSGNLSVHRATGDASQLTLSGSGSIDISELFCLNANMNIYGSGKITVAGVCDNEHLKITGSGDIHAYDFPVQSATITISGSGNAYTNIDSYLSGHISGSGDIHLIGDPSIEQTITGSGRIIKHK